MILHIGTNAWQIMNDRDPGGRQSVGGPNPGELQQPW
jgi:hypothetical protein